MPLLRARTYPWAIVVVAALAMVGTLPGRSQGLGLITEPLLDDLEIDRFSYATLNMWATLIGAGGAIGIGRVLDRFGSRVVLTAIAVTLGIIVMAMSQVTTFAGVAVAVTLTRTVGQSALSVVSLAMIGHWFVRRIDAAMAVFSVVMSIGFMAAFPLTGWAIQRWGWRAAWLSIGIWLVAGLAPLAAVVVRRSPESAGLGADGVSTPGAPPRAQASDELFDGATWQVALASPAFWVFAIGAALYGLVASGIGLFNESIVEERGFGRDIYYQSLVVTAMTGLAGNFLGGWLAQRVRLGRVLFASLASLTIGLAVLPHLSTVTHVMAWATLMGLGGGLVMVLFFSVWPRVYGRRHLGRIQGIAQALTVIASAIGPLLLAACIMWTGSYAAMFRILAIVIAAVAVAALVVPVRVYAPAPAPLAEPAP
jgi:MFS family permease